MPRQAHPQRTDPRWPVSPRGCSEEGGRSHGCSCQFALWSSRRNWGQGRLHPIKNTTKLTADYFTTLHPIRCTRRPRCTWRLSGFRSVLCLSVGLYPPWRSSMMGSRSSWNTSYVSSSPATQPTVMMKG